MSINVMEKYRKSEIEIRPVTVSVRGAGRMLGVGKTMIHRLITAGRLTKVKAGRRTLVTVESIEQFATPPRRRDGDDTMMGFQVFQ